MSDCVEEETPDVIAWKKDALNVQQCMLLRLGDREWDSWQKSNEKILGLKVEYGLYLLSERNTLTGYTDEQSKRINIVSKAILENAEAGNNIYFSCIFVFGKMGDKQFYTPVFKVKGNCKKTLFVDSDGLVYKNWEDYLNSNHLPKCLYCYPRDGLYQEEEDKVIIDFSKSPALDSLTANSSETWVNFASIAMIRDSLLGALIHQYCAIANPIPEIDNSFQGVDDQQLPGENVNSDKSEADEDFLKNISIFFKFLQSLLRDKISRAAAVGEVSSTVEVNTYDFISFSINSLEIIRNVFMLVDKKEKGELTFFDESHFEASVLFFCNYLLEASTAREVIEDAQKKVLEQHSDGLTQPQKDEFFKLARFSEGANQIQKNSNIIKAINSIDDKETFYESLVTIKGDLAGHQVGFSSEEPGLVNVNNELHIAPNKLIEISSLDRTLILNASLKRKDSSEVDGAYWSQIGKVLNKYRLNMQWQRNDYVLKLNEAFKTDNLGTIKINGREIFKNMTPSELDTLGNVVVQVGRNPKIFEIANEFAAMRNCMTPRDYYSYLEFVYAYIVSVKNEKVNSYKAAVAARDKGITEQAFAKKMGIKGRQEHHFFNQSIDEFTTNREESFKALEERYASLVETVQPLNANMSPNFATEACAIYHYVKHSKGMTEEQYFSLCSELVNQPINLQSVKLNQQGNKLIFAFKNPINKFFGVVCEKLSDKRQTLVTVFKDNKIKI